MKIYKLTSILILIMCLSCGCMAKTPLQERAIVMAMGIDYEEEEYKLTIQKFASSQKDGAGESDNESEISISTGKTLFEALKNAQSDDGKEIFYGHSRVYIIGRNAAKLGLKPILEFMNSNYQLSLNSSVLTSPQTAESILKNDVFIKNSPNISMKIIENSGKTVDSSIIDTLIDANNLNGTFVLPTIRVNNDKEMLIENGVVFKGAKVLLGLDSEQTMGYNLIKGKVKDGIFVVKKGNGEETISVNVSIKNTKNKVKVNNGEIVFCVYIDSRGNISETGISQEKEMNSEYINLIEKRVKEKIYNQVKTALDDIVLERKCDAFYIKNMIKNADYKLYKKISEQPLENWLPTIKFDIKVSFNITHLGVQIK